MRRVSKTPQRLYKYRAFNTNTLRLLSQAEVFYADPTKLNDPMDCRPVVRVDTDSRMLEKLCYRMLVLVRGKEKALTRMSDHRYMSTEHGDWRKDKNALECYTEDLRQEITGLLYSEMRAHGVLSLAGRWDCPLMWSHYGDEHRGVCIEYSTADHKCENLAPVDYTTRGEISISDIYNWKIKGSVKAERAVRGAFFYAKAKQWRYEREWRDVSDSSGAVEAPIKISAVYFGFRCDYAVSTSVVRLYTNSASAVKFFNIYRKDDSFRLKRREANVAEIEACGLRTSTRWDFDKLDAH